MKNRFDLEHEIMDCWGVVDDINTVYHSLGEDTSDEIANALLGIKALYQLKFEKLFNTFEDCIKQKSLNGDDHWTDIVRYRAKEL